MDLVWKSGLILLQEKHWGFKQFILHVLHGSLTIFDDADQLEYHSNVVRTTELLGLWCTDYLHHEEHEGHEELKIKLEQKPTEF